MAYKHTFSYASDYDVAIVLVTKSKRKRYPYDVQILEPFPDTFDEAEQIEILNEAIKECRRKIKRIARDSMMYLGELTIE